MLVRNLILAWCTLLRVCVATRVLCACDFQLVSSTLPAVGTALFSCLQLAMLFHPVWVFSFPLW